MFDLLNMFGYFNSNHIFTFKVSIMKDSMLVNVCLRNGVKEQYTTNDNECMNSKFKKHINYNHRIRNK